MKALFNLCPCQPFLRIASALIRRKCLLSPCTLGRECSRNIHRRHIRTMAGSNPHLCGGLYIYGWCFRWIKFDSFP